MPREDLVRDVPSSLRRQVFKEYGIVNPRREDYELDYLIALGLGGRGETFTICGRTYYVSVVPAGLVVPGTYAQHFSVLGYFQDFQPSLRDWSRYTFMSGLFSASAVQISRSKS